MGFLEQCPYPACDLRLEGDALRTCACSLRQPVLRCPTCHQPNREQARFCRACGADISPPPLQDLTASRLQMTGVLGMQGSFRRPPIAVGGALYAVSIDGGVHRLWPQSGATSQQVARFELASAGYNRIAAANVTARSASLHGWTLFGIGPSGLGAVSLASGAFRMLAPAQFPEEFAANRSEADSTGFKGVVANSEFAAFAVKRPGEEIALAVKHFDDRPHEETLVLLGREVAGPALCGPWLMLCTERQVGVINRKDGRSVVKNLPRQFSPLLTPSAPGLTIPPGSLPLAIATLAGGERAVCIAGLQHGRAGVLYVPLRDEAQDFFQELPRGSSFCTGQDGTACVAQPGEVLVMLAGETRQVALRAQPGMPVFSDEPYLLSFAATDFAEQQTLALTRSGRRVEAPLRGTNPRLDRTACCGAGVLNQGVVVTYLNVLAEEDDPGLSFAHFEKYV